MAMGLKKSKNMGKIKQNNMATKKMLLFSFPIISFHRAPDKLK